MSTERQVATQVQSKVRVRVRGVPSVFVGRPNKFSGLHLTPTCYDKHSFSPDTNLALATTAKFFEGHPKDNHLTQQPTGSSSGLSVFRQLYPHHCEVKVNICERRFLLTVQKQLFMAPSVYSGPLALAQSKHASVQQRKTVPAAVCPAIMSPVLSSIETIATKTQVAATDLTLQNAGTQLALLQGNALKQEVEKHAARLTNTISATIMNTRQLLELLRKSMEKENLTDAKIIEHLWAELEQLFTAAQETRAAIPTFIEKQRNSTSLYYASMMNETMQENQEELNIQNKKLNIQSSLIIEQQEAFNDYKLQIAGRLQELQNLHDQVSRLTLEKGHIRAELEESNKLLAEEKAAKKKVNQVCDSLRHEQEALLTSETNLQAECDTLRMELGELQEKSKSTEQQTVGRLTAELQAKVDELAKVAQKITDLNAEIRAMKDETVNAKMETEKLKTENKTVSEKYKMLSGEHGVAFTVRVHTAHCYYMH